MRKTERSADEATTAVPVWSEWGKPWKIWFQINRFWAEIWSWNYLQHKPDIFLSNTSRNQMFNEVWPTNLDRWHTSTYRDQVYNLISKDLRPTAASLNMAAFMLLRKFTEGSQTMEEHHTYMKMTFDARNRRNRQAHSCLLALLAVRSPFRADSSF